MCDFENEQPIETHDEEKSRAYCIASRRAKLVRYKELVDRMEKSLMYMSVEIDIDLSGEKDTFWCHAFKFDEANSLLKEEFFRKDE